MTVSLLLGRREHALRALMAGFSLTAVLVGTSPTSTASAQATPEGPTALEERKTGLTFNYGSNAGIVRSLPGQPQRRYVISFLSSLGYRYTDDAFASRASYPCYDPVGPICYTQKITALARQLDAFLGSGP